jgi:hypothetical protein
MIVGLSGCALLPVPPCESPTPLVGIPAGTPTESSGVAVIPKEHSISVWLTRPNAEFSLEAPSVVEYAGGLSCGIKLSSSTARGFVLPLPVHQANGVRLAWCDEKRGFCAETYVDLTHE